MGRRRGSYNNGRRSKILCERRSRWVLLNKRPAALANFGGGVWRWLLRRKSKSGRNDNCLRTDFVHSLYSAAGIHRPLLLGYTISIFSLYTRSLRHSMMKTRHLSKPKQATPKFPLACFSRQRRRRARLRDAARVFRIPLILPYRVE